MRVAGMRHDIAQVLDGDASVIGFQERLFSRPALRAALPKSWTLLMPKGPTGTDDNPIAFDKRRLGRLETDLGAPPDRHDLAALLRSDRPRPVRRGGRAPATAKTGHTIRALSFHLPNHLRQPPLRVAPTTPTVAASEADVADGQPDPLRSRRTRPTRTSSSAMCDCNVTANRDTTDDLVKGRITRPLRLETNYSADQHRRGSGIDYVMGERDSDFRHPLLRTPTGHLVTDHPGVVATFQRVRLKPSGDPFERPPGGFPVAPSHTRARLAATTGEPP